jgi:hypothetical protein
VLGRAVSLPVLPVHKSYNTWLHVCCRCRQGLLHIPMSEALERAVTLRKLLARQILKLEGGGGGASLQPMWGPQGFNAQDPILLVRAGVCTS